MEWDRGDFVPRADEHINEHVTLRMSAHVMGEPLEEEQELEDEGINSPSPPQCIFEMDDLPSPEITRG